jgi:hypothetical protein
MPTLPQARTTAPAVKPRTKHEAPSTNSRTSNRARRPGQPCEAPCAPYRVRRLRTRPRGWSGRSRFATCRRRHEPLSAPGHGLAVGAAKRHTKPRIVTLIYKAPGSWGTPPGARVRSRGGGQGRMLILLQGACHRALTLPLRLPGLVQVLRASYDGLSSASGRSALPRRFPESGHRRWFVGREPMNSIAEPALACPVREVLCEATRRVRHALAVSSDWARTCTVAREPGARRGTRGPPEQ